MVPKTYVYYSLINHRRSDIHVISKHEYINLDKHLVRLQCRLSISGSFPINVIRTTIHVRTSVTLSKIDNIVRRSFNRREIEYDALLR